MIKLMNKHGKAPKFDQIYERKKIQNFNNVKITKPENTKTVKN